MPLIKKHILSLAEKMFNWLDTSLRLEEIQHLFLSSMPGIQDFQFQDEDIKQTILDLHDNLSILGWAGMDGVPNITSITSRVCREGVERINKWKSNKMDVISGGVVKAGCSYIIEKMILNGKEERRLASIQIEKLLRHVEVRRKDSLSAFFPKLSMKDTWLERLAISVTFSRYARISGDLRYLNAGMKMNDWYFKRYRNRKLDDEKLNYLLALSEQERCIVELM